MSYAPQFGMRAWLLGLMVGILGSTANAADRYPQSEVRGQRIEVSVVDLNHQPFPIYRANGSYHIAGDEGARYGLSVRNHYPYRVMVVMAVDGVNIVTGQTAGWRQPGYVLEPGQATLIEGWRKSAHDVARFYFTYASDSYASKTGRANHVGVIGFAVFDEKQHPQMWHDNHALAESARERAAPASAGAPSAQSKSHADAAELGTGHGERAYSRVYSTEFERAASTPAEVISIRYNSVDNLIRMGVIDRPWQARDRGPVAFPQEHYVPDPTW